MAHSQWPSNTRIRAFCSEANTASAGERFLNANPSDAKTHKTRDDARQAVFDYIEMFYNLQRKHAKNGMLSPVDFEIQQKLNPQSVWEPRDYSSVA